MSVGYCPIPGMSQPTPAPTYEEKRRWLWRYRDALRRERELKDELQEQMTRAAGATAALTGMPGAASDGQTLPRAVESIVEAQQELQAQINVCGAIRREVVAALDQIADARDHEILRRRYLRGQKWEAIAYEMNLEYSTVMKRHRKALGKMSIEIH